MKDSPGKILEYKKKILSHIRSRENSLALKLFHKHFNIDSPPDPQFVINIYTELNKLDQIELGFRFLDEVASWLPDEAEIQELRNTALKIYFDRLIVDGNRYLTEREEKANKFHDSLKRTDSLSKEKVKEENEKLLRNIANKALESFRKAFEINPDSMAAISGLYRVYCVLQDEENINKFQKLLEEKNPLLYSSKSESEEKDSVVSHEFDIEEFNINEVKNLFEKNKYEEVIQRVDFLHLTHKISVPLLILKAESLVSLKRFKEADKVIFEAEKQNSHLKEVRELKNHIYEIKYNLLSKAGELYLKKALELGPSLGEKHFKKARICLKKALDIFPENIELLDQQYTVLRYLNETEEAFKTKAMIYLLNNRYIPTFDKEGANSFCFLATYAYKRDSKELMVFRWFRREFLLTSNIGKYLNCVYVRNSQKILSLSRKYSISPAIFRAVLFPIYAFLCVLAKLFKISRN
ncbi:MAG: hypothetical protein Kow0029_10990 [Candidatus Rifleibacteriota bacterium]